MRMVLGVQLPDAVIKSLMAASGVRYRNRILTPTVTVWGLTFQALSPKLSDADLVQHVNVWLKESLRPDSGALSSARTRLPLSVIEGAAKHVAENAPQHCAAFPERRVLILDGSTIELADTPENQAKYPQSSTQKAGCGFPLLHFAALIDHATGCIVDMVCGPLNVHDARLARPLWDRIQPGDIVLADRAYASFCFIAAMRDRGADVVVHQHQRRTTQPMEGDMDDRQAEWTKPRAYVDWWDAELPKTLGVRVVQAKISPIKILIVNTTLDPDAYPPATILALYQTRWRIETFFADLKITLGLEDYHAKSPETAVKALWVHALAHNLVCGVLVGVADAYDLDRNELSFKRAVQALISGVALVAETVREAWQWVANMVARCPKRHRPGRQEPRRIKKRLKPYPYITRARRFYKALLLDGSP